MFSHVLINFDEINAKEIRIIVIELEGIINKVRIKPFGKSNSNDINMTQNIDYVIYSPRDGEYNIY